MKYWFFFIVSFLLLAPIDIRADTIILAADEWCPYNCKPNTTREGYMIDIARNVFEKAGYTIEYKTMSWARSIADAKTGKITGVVGAVPEEVSDFILTKEPLGFSQDCLYVLSKNPWRYQNIAGLSKINSA